jgi:hypothetical protein
VGHIILVVATAGSPTAGDTVLQGRLEAAGHTVTRTSDEDAEYSGSYDGVVVSDSSSGGTFGAKYDTVAKPGIALEAATWRLGSYVGATTGVTQWTVSAVSGANGGLTGTQTVFSSGQSQQGISVSSLPAGATLVANQQGDTNKGIYVIYEAGGNLTSGTAPARRVFLRIGDPAMPNLASAGTTLLDAAIAWAFDTGGSGGGSGVLFRAASEDARGTTTAPTPVPPAGTASEDYLLAVQTSDYRGSLDAMTAPDNSWSLLGSTSRSDVGFVKVWRKIATGSEPASYTWPDSTSAHSNVVITALYGYDPSQPLAVTPTFSDGAASTSHSAPSVTGTAGGMLITAYVAGTNGTTRDYTGTPAGMSLAQDATLSSAGYLLTEVYYQALTAGGATGAKTATCSASTPFITMSLVVQQPSAQTLAPSSINSAEAFGTPSVTLTGGVQTLSPTGIASAEAFGVPTVTQPLAPGPFPGPDLYPGPNIYPSEVPPAAEPQTILPATIASAEAFGAPIVSLANGEQFVRVTAIDSAETWSIPTVTVDPIGTQYLETVGIASREAFGRPIITREVPIPVISGAWYDTYFVDGVNLSGYAWNIETSEGLISTPGMVGENVEIPGRDGQLQVFGGLGQQRRPDALGRITFNMWLLGGDTTTGYVPGGSTTQSEWYDRWDELLRILHRRQVVLDHPRPDGSIRRAYAHLLPDETVAPSRSAGTPWFGRLRVAYAIPAAHWVDLAPVTTGPASLATNGYLSLEAFAAATAPCTELTVTFGSSNNPRLSTAYGHVGWNNVIAAGRQLGIDTAEHRTHQASGTAWTPGYEHLTYAPGPRLFEIDPSESLGAILTHTTGGQMTVEVSGKRRYRTS